MQSIAKSTDSAMDQVKESASLAKGSLLEFGTQVLKLVNGLRAFELRGTGAILNRLGLQRKQSFLVPVAWFAAGGIAVGSIVFALSPLSGREVRMRVKRIFEEDVEKAKEVGKRAESKVKEAVTEAKKTVTGAMPGMESRDVTSSEEGRRVGIPKNEHAPR